MKPMISFVQASKFDTHTRASWLWLIIFIPLLVYSLLLSHLYSGDDLQYAMVIERATTGQSFYHPTGDHLFEPGYLDQSRPQNMLLPVNPRYLLEYPTSIGMVKLWRAFGYDGYTILPVLSLRILVGSLGLLFITLAMFALTRRRLLAFLGCLGIAFSLAYWTYSTHLDQSINMVALASLVLWLLIRQWRDKGYFNSTSLAIPFLMSLATLYNFTAVIIAGVIALVVTLTDTRLPWKNRALRLIRFALIYGVVLVGVLATAVILSAGPAALSSPAYWASVTFAGHPEYNVNILGDLFRAILGFEKSQVTFPGTAGAFQAFWNAASSAQKTVLLAFYAFIGLFFAAPFAYLARNNRGRGFLERQNAPLWLLLAIFLSYSLFNWFWDPGYIKYWLIPLICWWLVAVFIAADAQSSLVRWRRSPLFMITTLILLSLVFNLAGIIIRESRLTTNPWLEMSQTLKASPTNALFISKGTGLDFYLSYFTRRDIISLELITYANSGSSEAADRVLANQIAAHLQDNAPIYFFGFDEADKAQIEHILQLSRATRAVPAWQFPELTIHEAVR